MQYLFVMRKALSVKEIKDSPEWTHLFMYGTVLKLRFFFFQLGKHVESALKLKPGSYKKTS